MPEIGVERRLDVTGRHHGLRGRIARFIEHLGDEFEQLLVAAEHLRAGGLLIMVRADHDNKRAAVRILQEHGGARTKAHRHNGPGGWPAPHRTPIGRSADQE